MDLRNQKQAEHEFRILPCGDCAVSIEFGEQATAEASAKVRSLERQIEKEAVPGVLETVPTYRALLIVYDPLQTSHQHLEAVVGRAVHAVPLSNSSNRHWTVPVVYGGEDGIDLYSVAEQHGLSEADVIDLHAAADYEVRMIGFMPGFTYLGGLPARLATPRRRTPRPAAPPGTISIGGSQTAIQSVTCPSGWHWIGRTPLEAYDPKRMPLCLFDTGDRVRFKPIKRSEWAAERRIWSEIASDMRVA